MVFLAVALRSAGIVLKGDLILQSVIEDETTGNGTLGCMARGYDADAAVIVDGTNQDTVITAHSGGVHFRITVLGRSGPSAGNPSAANAIHEACGIIAALRDLQDRKLSSAARGPMADPAPCPFSMHATGIEGGEGLGNVSAWCDGECTAHFSPEDTVKSVRGEIEACVENAASRSPWLREHPPRLTYHALSYDAVAARQDSELVRLLQRCGRQTLGVSIRPTAVAGWGDLRHFSLNKPTDCCFYGPGVYGGGMHSPDEYAQLDGMLPVSRVLASLVLAWYGCEH